MGPREGSAVTRAEDPGSAKGRSGEQWPRGNFRARGVVAQRQMSVGRSPGEVLDIPRTFSLSLSVTLESDGFEDVFFSW